jgi:parallel beta-helix repeat protein
MASLLVPVLGEAATRSLDCSTGTINAFLPRLRSGDTLLVTGTCNENVVIGAGRNNITLNGQGTATINGTDPTSNTIIIRANNVTIKGFTITGGSRGILINRGGEATIDGNNIHSTGSDGVQVSDGSSARIINNQIHDNPVDGIIVIANASANIGVLTGSDTTASPNTIQNNGGSGIVVFRTASVRAVGNTISGNAVNGITVGNNSYGDIANNVINSNAGHGISLFRGGDVQLGRDTGTTIFDLPNSTTANNTLNGIICRLGGSADGRLGTLTGTAGTKDIAGGGTNCIDSLLP